MSEAKKGEIAIRDKAILHQQRRLKQATQFTHKDSADLLPLDGLKRLGTSKDLQPHSIVQRRLLEGNITRLRGEGRDLSSRVRSPLADTKDGPADTEERSESTADDSTEERESLEESERSLRSDEEDDSSEAGARQTAEKPEGGESSPVLTALIIQCKCCETEVKASINTGSQHNHISTSCCQRLGLVPRQASSPCDVNSSVTELQLQLGTQRVQCSAYIKEDEAFELCLGLQTLLELKCCLDLSSRVLKLQGCGEDLPFLNPLTDSQCQHDTNENL
ncbi:nuclear receptor-interacting protein 2 [Neolamprologus brichardi]|uniref:nuclear receptor-interacting protein 2 n=1 Tax=Neolamprologus brichardi TaxID=32507 RepID=UPI0003EBD68E|nr:nuclear receptor-interacting protein 2 [Neolamprologus brichardi]